MAFFDFEDNRYKGTRAPLVWGVAGVVVVTIILTILTVRELGIREVEAKEAMLDKERTSAPLVLTPEEAQARQIKQLHADLEFSWESQNWVRLEKQAAKIFAMAPADGAAWSYMGRLRAQQKDDTRAIAALGKAIDENYLPAFNLYQRSLIYRRLGDYPSALRDMKAAAVSDPRGVETSNFLLITQIEAGQVESVRSVLSKYQDARPGTGASSHLLADAALALHDGDVPKAALALAKLQAQVSPEVFRQLCADRYFEPYRSESLLQSFFEIK